MIKRSILSVVLALLVSWATASGIAFALPQAAVGQECSLVDQSLRQTVIAHVEQYDKIHVNRAGCDRAEAEVYEFVMDDSVQSVLHALTLEFREASWVVVSDSHSWRCHVGRGHQDYSTELCI